MQLINYSSDLFAIITRPLGYQRVYMPLCKVADTPFHNQMDKLLSIYMTLSHIHINELDVNWSEAEKGVNYTSEQSRIYFMLSKLLVNVCVHNDTILPKVS